MVYTLNHTYAGTPSYNELNEKEIRKLKKFIASAKYYFIFEKLKLNQYEIYIHIDDKNSTLEKCDTFVETNFIRPIKDFVRHLLFHAKVEIRSYNLMITITDGRYSGSYEKDCWKREMYVSKDNVFKQVRRGIRIRNIVNVFVHELFSRIYAPPNGKAYLRAKADFTEKKG